MLQILLAPGEQIIERHNISAVGEQEIAKMGTQKSGATCDEDELACPVFHRSLPSPALHRPQDLCSPTFKAWLSFHCFVQDLLLLTDGDRVRSGRPLGRGAADGSDEIPFEGRRPMRGGVLGEHTAACGRCEPSPVLL